MHGAFSQKFQVIEIFTLSYSWWVCQTILYYGTSNHYIINVSRVGLNTINVHEYRTYTAVCITSPGDFNVTLPTKNAMYLLGLQNM